MTTNPSHTPGSGDASTGQVSAATDAGDGHETATLVQRLAAEALGTFVFLFLGAGAVAFTAASLGSSDLGDFGGLGVNALAFAFALAVAGYGFARVSGGHFNPAVTVGSVLAGRTAWKDAGLYVAAQVGGAIVAGLVLFVLILGFDRSDAQDSLWQTGFGDSFNDYAWWAAFLLEVLLTIVFVYLVLAVTDRRHDERSSFAPLAIGLGYGAVVFAGAAATGGSANPARSIGTNLFAGVDPVLSLWVFILAPLVGAVVAGVTYPLLFGRDRTSVAGSGLNFGGGGGPRRSRKQDQQQQYAGWNQGYYGDAQQGQQGWGQQQGGYPQQGYDQQQGGWQGQPQQGGYDQGYGQQQGGYDQGYGGQQGGYDQQQPYDQQGQSGQGQGQPGYGQQDQGGWQGQPPQQGGYEQQGEQPQQGWESPEDGGHTRMRPGQEP